MEVTKTIANNNKTASQISFKNDLTGLSSDEKQELLDLIGGVLVDQILLSVAATESPVDGVGNFKPLTKKYAELKKEETGSTDPNLDLRGDMLNALEYTIKGDSIELGIFGSEAPKADGHNNFSGKSQITTRQFLPKAGQEFTSNIQSMVDDVINTYVADHTTFSKKQLESINSKDDLYSMLKSELGDLSRLELKSLVLRSELAAELDAADLLDLL